MTKAEYVRSLSDDELAKFIRNISLSGCAVCAYAEHCFYDGVEEDFCLFGVEQWLKQEHKESSNEL